MMADANGAGVGAGAVAGAAAGAGAIDPVAAALNVIRGIGDVAGDRVRILDQQAKALQHQRTRVKKDAKLEKEKQKRLSHRMQGASDDVLMQEIGRRAAAAAKAAAKPKAKAKAKG
jgi:hypothetical protein